MQAPAAPAAESPPPECRRAAPGRRGPGRRGALLPLLILGLTAAPAFAAPVSVRVEGTLTDALDNIAALPPALVENASDGDTSDGPSYVLEYRYDTEGAVDLNDETNTIGQYRPMDASLSFTAEGFALQCDPPDGLDVFVGNRVDIDVEGEPEPQTGDELTAQGRACTSEHLAAATVELASVTFLDLTNDGEAIDSDALPSEAPDLSDWRDAGFVAVAGCPDGSPGCDPASQGFALTGNVTFVPEPGDLALAGTALGSLAFLSLAGARRRPGG